MRKQELFKVLYFDQDSATTEAIVNILCKTVVEQQHSFMHFVKGRARKNIKKNIENVQQTF